MKTVTLQQPRRIVFGAGALGRLPAEAALAGWKRLHVVAGRHAAVAHAAELAAWRRQGFTVEVTAGVDAEPDIAAFHRVLDQVRATEPDAVVGIGGGSVLDVAKLAAALAAGRQQIHDVFGVDLLQGPRLGLACIPTTAGTGADVSPNAILLDESARQKRGVVSPLLVPDCALCDPALTVSLPAPLTAATGMDALVHCIEAYANSGAHPATDVLALEGVRRIGRSLHRAVENGADLAARTDVMLGALHGGLCLGPVNTAAVHALSYPLGGEYRIPHGVANAVLLTSVLEFNLAAAPDRYAEIARALGAEPGPTALATAQDGLARLAGLARACGIPPRLRDLGVPADALPRLAEKAVTVTRLLVNNPRPVGVDDALEIYRHAY